MKKIDRKCQSMTKTESKIMKTVEKKNYFITIFIKAIFWNKFFIENTFWVENLPHS